MICIAFTVSLFIVANMFIFIHNRFNEQQCKFYYISYIMKTQLENKTEELNTAR